MGTITLPYIPGPTFRLGKKITSPAEENLNRIMKRIKPFLPPPSKIIKPHYEWELG